MGNKKVHVPRVVVHTNPLRRGSLLALVAVALVVVAAVSYRYGRTHALPVPAPPDSAAAQARLAEWEAERTALKQRVSELQRQLRATAATSSPTRAPSPVERAEPAPAAAETAPEPVAVSAPVADNRLRLQDMRITPMEGEHHYRLRFTVTHGADPDAQVVGTIWIAVNGLIDGEPVRLPLEKVSPGNGQFVKMDFRQRQQVDTELRLPSSFVARNVSVEAKPYNKKYREAAGRIEWLAGP